MRIILIEVQFERVRDMVCERRFYFYPSTCAKFDRVTPSSPGIIVCIVPRSLQFAAPYSRSTRGMPFLPGT